MLFAVRFTDQPGSGALRAGHMADHLAWLARHSQVLAAGTLCESPQAAALGGLWLVDAESADAVRALVATDPFMTCGLRANVEILHWLKGHPAGPVTL